MKFYISGLYQAEFWGGKFKTNGSFIFENEVKRKYFLGGVVLKKSALFLLHSLSSPMISYLELGSLWVWDVWFFFCPCENPPTFGHMIKLWKTVVYTCSLKTVTWAAMISDDPIPTECTWASHVHHFPITAESAALRSKNCHSLWNLDQGAYIFNYSLTGTKGTGRRKAADVNAEGTDAKWGGGKRVDWHKGISKTGILACGRKCLQLARQEEWGRRRDF